MSSTVNATKLAAASIVAMLAIVGSVTVMLGNESNAAYSASYGEIYEIDLAPGFSYTYTPSYPADLDVTTSIEKYESAGITASINSGKTLSVTVNSGVTSGSYDLILKATTSTGGLSQTAYQHIRFNIVSGLTVAPGQVINDIIKGATIDFTPQATSDMGSVTWTVNGSLPAGLSFSGGKVTGTPTQVGTNTISLTASARGEAKNLEISFTVYNVIVGGSAETIFSNGNAVSSAAIAQTGSDLGVTWNVTSGTLPSGFTLNSTTGVVSGSSTTLQETVVTITGTAANGPVQTTTKEITIRSEPAIQISGDASAITYPDADPVEVQLSATSGTSAVTWSVSSATGVTIDQTGKLRIANTASAGSVTVTATTAYGGSNTHVVTISREAAGTITGSDTLNAIAGTPNTADFTCNVAGGTWDVNIDGVPAGVSVTIDQDGKVSVSSAAPTEAFSFTITYTTPGDQQISKTVSSQVIPKLIFDTVPSNGLVVIEA